MRENNNKTSPETMALDLYAAVGDGPAFEAALDRVRQALGATSHLTQMAWIEDGWPVGSDVTVHAGFEPETMDCYRRAYFRHDPWMRAAVGLPSGVLNFDRHVPETEMRRTLYWNEFGGKYDAPLHCLAVKFPERGGLVGGFAVHRRAGADPFEAEEERLLAFLAPHLTRVFVWRARLLEGAPPGALEAALGAIGRGAAILDAQGRHVFANPALEAIAAKGDGLALGPYGLRPADPVAARAVHQAQMAALAAADGKLRMMEGVVRAVVPRGRAEPPYVVEAVPLRLAANDLRPGFQGALLLVTDTAARPSPRANLLREAFGLSPAEATLAAGLAEGRTLAELARERRVSAETLRSQLSSIFRKTGCHRQADLVRLASRLLDG